MYIEWITPINLSIWPFPDQRIGSLFVFWILWRGNNSETFDQQEEKCTVSTDCMFNPLSVNFLGHIKNTSFTESYYVLVALGLSSHSGTADVRKWFWRIRYCINSVWASLFNRHLVCVCVNKWRNYIFQRRRQMYFKGAKIHMREAYKDVSSYKNW